MAAPAQPSSTVRYDRWQRFRDRSAGRRDGRRNIPSLGEAERAGAGLQTAYVEQLNQEYLTYVRSQLQATYRGIRTAGKARLDPMDQAIESLAELVERCEQMITGADAPLTPNELLPRNADEQKWEPEHLHHRREIRREYRGIRARRELDAARKQLEQQTVQRRQVQRGVEEQLERVRDEVRRAADFFGLRASAYWDGVTTTHRNGRHLGWLVGLPQFPVPGWAQIPIDAPLGADDDPSYDPPSDSDRRLE